LECAVRAGEAGACPAGKAGAGDRCEHEQALHAPVDPYQCCKAGAAWARIPLVAHACAMRQLPRLAQATRVNGWSRPRTRSLASSARSWNGSASASRCSALSRSPTFCGINKHRSWQDLDNLLCLQHPLLEWQRLCLVVQRAQLVTNILSAQGAGTFKAASNRENTTGAQPERCCALNPYQSSMPELTMQGYQGTRGVLRCQGSRPRQVEHRELRACSVLPQRPPA
jgi:hypothetical protein